ncbi:triphosphoribosyl-dephospho-CoA synthase [Pseudomonas sp. SWI6]|uniref:Probable 2-(5''-triphosphoribosyl)-3'-dephosphocoenzyme-A synthase n=2 Tax=Pseudomonas TaxID=286 RepID=A0ABR6VEG5_9PSED|nr:triphosphoribosyl-dephospho-CoA synthase [Pseudomonas sp. SWI6]AVD90678.1 triphosphoribosyl-dephospho-CoA synthase [Pseudomonas sp. SWI44]MBC3478794.1 triphosphoribosyl-dephospho-CoA synthase [Pseudomonas taiwanensis]MBC3493898.1 triphosphoribosyl-dephospho-CoA synthase [Pseudomonas taiwanensis]QQZ38338.1 triphosphoribosyl-dephospho-CoA synthase [Pseudomonas sp. SK2]
METLNPQSDWPSRRPLSLEPPAGASLPAMRPERSSAITLPEHLADLAVAALIDEADLSPKPGLVDRRSSGAHNDMTLSLMHASAMALWPCLRQMAEAAQDHGYIDQPLRGALGRIGREGEAAMLSVTAGVNTHRGAIWALGLLVAACALDPGAGAQVVAARAGRIALLDDPAAIAPDSHGNQVRRRYGASGAREQAQQGFPAVIEHGLPQLLRSRAAGASETHARLDALLAIMAALSDTCVLWRAGPQGLATVQQGARAVLDAGGSATLGGRRQLRQLEMQLLQLNASPGGAADLLAACLFLDFAGSL